MPKSSTLTFTSLPKTEKTDFIPEVFFSKREKEEILNLNALLKGKRKSPSETSLRIIREYSRRISPLLQA